MYKPFFSIIIPIYNKEKYLSNTIASVLNQSFSDLEIIAVDDGSTDASVDSISMVKDSRLKLWKKSNGGPSSARNLGISKAIGEYICFLDADETYPPHHLSVLFSVLKKENYPEILINNWSFRGRKNYFFINSKNFFRIILRSKNFAWLPSFCFRTSLIKNDVLFNEKLKLGEDKDFLIRIFLKKPSFIFNNNSKLIYCEEDLDSLTRNPKLHKISFSQTFLSVAYQYLFRGSFDLTLYIIKYYYYYKQTLIKHIFIHN